VAKRVRCANLGLVQRPRSAAKHTNVSLARHARNPHVQSKTFIAVYPSQPPIRSVAEPARHGHLARPVVVAQTGCCQCECSPSACLSPVVVNLVLKTINLVLKRVDLVLCAHGKAGELPDIDTASVGLTPGAPLPREQRADPAADAIVLEAGANSAIHHDVRADPVVGIQAHRILSLEVAKIGRNREYLVVR
jgi:hypothetical protein